MVPLVLWPGQRPSHPARPLTVPSPSLPPPRHPSAPCEAPTLDPGPPSAGHTSAETSSPGSTSASPPPRPSPEGPAPWVLFTEPAPSAAPACPPWGSRPPDHSGPACFNSQDPTPGAALAPPTSRLLAPAPPLGRVTAQAPPTGSPAPRRPRPSRRGPAPTLLAPPPAPPRAARFRPVGSGPTAAPRAQPRRPRTPAPARAGERRRSRCCASPGARAPSLDSAQPEGVRSRRPRWGVAGGLRGAQSAERRRPGVPGSRGNRLGRRRRGMLETCGEPRAGGRGRPPAPPELAVDPGHWAFPDHLPRGAHPSLACPRLANGR